jgi:hypothetical protein
MEYSRFNFARVLALCAAGSMVMAGCGKQPDYTPTHEPNNVERYKACVKDLPNDDKTRDHCMKLVMGE